MILIRIIIIVVVVIAVLFCANEKHKYQIEYNTL